MHTLHTSADQLHDLLAAHDKTKASSTTVKVDRQALINLCMDHAKLFSLCKDKAREPINVQDASPARSVPHRKPRVPAAQPLRHDTDRPRDPGATDDAGNVGPRVEREPGAKAAGHHPSCSCEECGGGA